MKVYGARPSPFVRKVLIALEEKGISYDLEPPALELHPLGKMPSIRDGDTVVNDSSVIIAYLERTHPTPALLPSAPHAFAQALFLEEYADSTMADSMGLIVLERVIKPMMMGQPTDQAKLEAMQAIARERWFGSPRSTTGRPIASVMDYLESQLPSDRGTVLPEFSIADIALGAHIGWLAAGGLEFDGDRWPKARRYFAALEARPSFKATAAPPPSPI